MDVFGIGRYRKCKFRHQLSTFPEAIDEPSKDGEQCKEVGNGKSGDDLSKGDDGKTPMSSFVMNEFQTLL